MVVVLLAKVDSGAQWSGVTAEDVKASQARQPKTNPSDPNSGIMDLMKQMYDEGDDKMKQVSHSAIFLFMIYVPFTRVHTNITKTKVIIHYFWHLVHNIS